MPPLLSRRCYRCRVRLHFFRRLLLLLPPFIVFNNNFIIIIIVHVTVTWVYLPRLLRYLRANKTHYCNIIIFEGEIYTIFPRYCVGGCRLFQTRNDATMKEKYRVTIIVYSITLSFRYDV